MAREHSNFRDSLSSLGAMRTQQDGILSSISPEGRRR